MAIVVLGVATAHAQTIASSIWARGSGARIIVPPGESGSFTLADVSNEPPHLRDQLPLYEAFGDRRQPVTQGEVEGPITMEVVSYVRP